MYEITKSAQCPHRVHKNEKMGKVKKLKILRF